MRPGRSPGRVAVAPARRRSPSAPAPSAASRRRPVRGLVWAFGIAAAVALADIGSGVWAREHVPPALRPAGGVVRLTRLANHGASLGLGANHPTLVMAVSLVGVAAVGWWVLRARTAGESVAVAIVLGGAVANLGERVATGAVTDWIHVWAYPATFNPADVCIRGGIITAVLLRWRYNRSPGKPR